MCAATDGVRLDEDNDEAPARALIDTCGGDPGRQHGNTKPRSLHLLFLRPTLLHRDATYGYKETAEYTLCKKAHEES
jgi:hypothetical protein